MNHKEKVEKAINMLKSKFDEIKSIPQKINFTADEISFIKSMLGPWPRALEKAGLKEKKDKFT